MLDQTDATRKFQKEMNAGTTSLVLLSVLNRDQQPMYGYQIAKMLEEDCPGPSITKQGSLYPVLRSLEENGLLSSSVEPSVSGPPRRYYVITEDGRAALAEWIEIWNQIKKFVDTNLTG